MQKTQRKKILVTGAAHRIGKEICQFFDNLGYQVVLHYNSSGKAAELLAKKLKDPILIQADFENEKEIAGIFKKVGSVDILVNNASLFEPDEIASYEKHMQINLKVPFVLMDEFYKNYKGDDGHIINMLDYSVVTTPDCFVSYNLSKAGLWSLTKMLALKFAPKIRVNAIGPSMVFPSPRQSEESFKKAYVNSPLRLSSTAEEICKAIKFLTEVKSITGQIILLDGGKHLQNVSYDAKL